VIRRGRACLIHHWRRGETAHHVKKQPKANRDETSISKPKRQFLPELYEPPRCVLGRAPPRPPLPGFSPTFAANIFAVPILVAIRTLHEGIAHDAMLQVLVAWGGTTHIGSAHFGRAGALAFHLFITGKATVLTAAVLKTVLVRQIHAARSTGFERLDLLHNEEHLA
jgi:hypothetical protein